jgi:ADP-ribosylglycohydrolase
MVISRRDRIAGGLFGMLVGDALGVPYEFNRAADIPAPDQIEMQPPLGFVRSHALVPPGTWSDDGAQALCSATASKASPRVGVRRCAARTCLSRCLSPYLRASWHHVMLRKFRRQALSRTRARRYSRSFAECATIAGCAECYFSFWPLWAVCQRSTG